MATDFHSSLQDFINWLTQVEQTLNMVSPASLILETIMFQIDEHKVSDLHLFKLLSSVRYIEALGLLKSPHAGELSMLQCHRHRQQFIGNYKSNV